MPQLTSPTVTIARVIQCVGGVAQPATAHQRLPGALGTTEVQAAQDIQEGPDVLGPGVLATGKQLVAPTGSSPSALIAAVPAPKAGSR